MRSFDIEELAAIAQLDRGQIERLIDDPAFPLYGSEVDGERSFVAPDLFNIGVAGAFHRLGIGAPAIRAIVAALGPCEIDAQGWPTEMFPGQRRGHFTPCLIVVRPLGHGLSTSLVSPSELWAAIAAYDAGANLVVDATALAERIARAVDRPDAPLFLPRHGGTAERA